MAEVAASDWMGLKVAGLAMCLDARRSGVRMALPACHTRFGVPGAADEGLSLRIRDGPPHSTAGWRSLFCDAETWQLWQDDAGRQVFVAPRDSPPRRQVAVDAAFTAGEVIGEFGANGAAGRAVYPLQDIDMAIFANWLAETGDLIVHAAGVDDEGAGYAFVGPAGAGKSTLVAELAACNSRGAAEAATTDVSEAAEAATTDVSEAAEAATTDVSEAAEAATTDVGEAAEGSTANTEAVVVLGEDNLVLRYQKGKFLVYGTPWHTNPARCSPGGVPLVKLFFLDRANGHGIEPCGPSAGIERLLPDAIIPYYNRAGVERILDTLARLAEQVPLYTLGFQMGADVLGLIREA